MKTVRTVAALRGEVAAARDRARSTGPGAAVALVPTMGALHEGHLTLVDRARSTAPFVVMSVFVNPAQFGPGEDFDAYPRDLERDARLARQRGVDLVFAPPVAEVYPAGAPAMRVEPGPLAERLCGLRRPGHFAGVLTVVAKLFNMARPDVAVFGQKDFQQVTLIRRMARELDFPVHVETAPIVREADGLAMSSRNVYLSADERTAALSLSGGLFAARAAFAAGETEAGRLRGLVDAALRTAQVEPEYVELVDPDELSAVDRAGPGSVLAVAAQVGKTRLIDNLILQA